MKYLRKLFGSMGWWTLRPDAGLLAAQPGGDDPGRYVSAARSEDGSLAVLYLPVGGTVEVSDSPARRRRRSEWFDPRTGRTVPARPGKRGTFRAPDQQDWVLVLSDR